MDFFGTKNVETVIGANVTRLPIPMQRHKSETKLVKNDRVTQASKNIKANNKIVFAECVIFFRRLSKIFFIIYLHKKCGTKSPTKLILFDCVRFPIFAVRHFR